MNRVLPNKNYEHWWNTSGLEPNHPLRPRLQRFFELGADLVFIFKLCRMLGLANAARSCGVETNRKLADRKRRRWRKELHGLLSEHPGGKLRLTEVARHYTTRIIYWTAVMLTRKGLIDPTVIIDVSPEEGAWIKEQALKPFAKMKGFQEDWDAAIAESDYSGTSNLIAAVGGGNITPSEASWLENQFTGSLNGRSGRSDHAGTLFLLILTEHLRETTKNGKPHFKEAFNLMRSLQDKTLRKLGEPGKSAKSRVHKLKKHLDKVRPEWRDEIRRWEQVVHAANLSLYAEKVN